MKNKLLTKLFIIPTIFSLASCSSALSEMKLLRSPEGLSHDFAWETRQDPAYILFKEKMEAFAASISENYKKREFSQTENLVISPFSIELCLGLAVSSSDGVTRQELLDAMDVDFETFDRYYKHFYNEVLGSLTNQDNKVISEILLTNSIWIDNNIKLKDTGLDALKDDYYCYSYEADFDEKLKQSIEAIREFISDKTRGLLRPSLDLSEETLFVLMNTIYLKDVWNRYGDDLPYASDAIKFTNYNGQVSNKKLLRGDYVSGRKYVSEDFSSFYTAGQMVKITFIKPSEGKRIDEVFTKENIEAALDTSNYVRIDNEKKEIYYTETIFPEYEADCDYKLNDMFIEDYNVKSLFSDTCNFDNLVYPDDQVYCETFKQIAKLKVNKKGIEGAAVTYMAMDATSAPIEEEYKDVYETFTVDKEFGYIISRNDAILFSGVVTNID